MRKSSKAAQPAITLEVSDEQSVALEASAVITAEAQVDGKPVRPTVLINAYNGGVIRASGYYLPVAIDLAGLQGLGKPIPLYRSHDHNRIVGHGTAVRQENALEVSGKLSADNSDTQEIVALSREGFPWQASVGVLPLRLEKVEPGSSVQVNGQPVSGPATIVRAGKLYEVSIVPTGADDSTSTRVAASQRQNEELLEMNFAAWLKSKGFIEAELSEGQIKALKAMFDAEQTDAGPSDYERSSVDDVLAAARNREARHAAYGRVIQAAIDRGMDTETAGRLVEAARNDNLSETDFELRVLRATRHSGGSHAPSRSNEVGGDVVEASLARAVGMSDIEKHYTPEVLQASERQFRHGLSLVELLLLGARRNGHHNVSHRSPRELLRAAFTPVQLATSGPSTYDIGGILSNVANKMILAGFLAVESEWRKIAAIGSVNDLKKHTSYALTGDMTYELVGKAGELKHATMGEESYENQARTYGRIFGVTEDDIINDDLGAFNRVRRMLGRGAALALNKVVWTEFLANAATFWTVARNNRITQALSIEGLSIAVTALEKQVDPDGEPMGQSGKVLVVPTDLKILAGQIANDTDIRKLDDGTITESYSTRNPHAGKFTVAASQYLNNATIPGGSATHWQLLADPEDMPTLEVVFLNGQQAPRIEEARADFDTLGIQMRGVHRFGAAKQEYRGSIYSEG